MLAMMSVIAEKCVSIYFLTFYILHPSPQTLRGPG